MKKYRVYCYTNVVNGMKYVGCTCTKYQCQRSGTNGEKYKGKFKESILAYGWNNYAYEVLEDNLDKEASEKKEQYWISELNTLWPNGYNAQLGGNNHSLSEGYDRHNMMTEEHKRKISEARKGKPSNNINAPRTEEWNKHISESLKGKRNRIRPVCAYFLNGDFYKRFDSLKEATESTGAHNICAVLHGNLNQSGGYIWKYSD